MDILKLIKNRRSIRKYKDNKIPKKIIAKIIDAGIWGPSIHHIQPWKFIIIENANIIKRIIRSLKAINRKVTLPRFIFWSTIQAIASAKIVICIYNTKELTRFFVKPKTNKDFVKNIMLVENSSIAATIQNMILVAESFGIGSCWLDTPLFCKRSINRILNTKDDLMAVLTLGYPAENGRRAPRKPILKTLKYIK